MWCSVSSGVVVCGRCGCGPMMGAVEGAVEFIAKHLPVCISAVLCVHVVWGICDYEFKRGLVGVEGGSE